VTVREAFELIDRLKTVKHCLQAKYSDSEIVNNAPLYKKIRRYNDEILKLEEAIMNMEFDDSYEFDYDLYYIKDDE
jgi:hypothetical protein